MNTKKGKPLYTASTKCFLLWKIIGCTFVIILTSLMLGTLIYSIIDTSRYTIYQKLLGIAIVWGVGLFILFVFPLSLALIRRAKIYENGITPDDIPYRKAFQKEEYFIPYTEIKSMGFIEGSKGDILIVTKNDDNAYITRSHTGQKFFDESVKIMNRIQEDKKVNILNISNTVNNN